MYVGTCLALPGFSPSTGPALGQTPAAHVVTDDYWGSWRLLLTPGPWNPLEGRKGWFCCSPSFLLSVESPLGHFPQCSGSQKAQIKGSESLMSEEFEGPGCSFAQQIVFRCLLSARPWEG